MASFSYPVTFASGKQGAIDSPVELSPDALQAQVADYDRQDAQQAQAANARTQADQQAGQLSSYGGAAVRDFISPLASSVRGVGEMLDSPTLIRGGNSLEQDTASAFPANPQYSNDTAGKIVGSTAGLAGGVLPFAVPVIGPEALGPASIVAQTYDTGLREGLNSGLPLSTAQDYARTHVALQAPLQIAGGRLVRGLVGAAPAAENVLPTLSNRLADLGTGALEAGGIGATSQLASNLQAGNAPLVGYNIDPNRGALDDVLSSGALMAGSAGLLGLPSALLRGRAATPTVDTTSSAQPDAPVVPDPDVASTPDTATPTPLASDGTGATPPVDATGTTSAQSTSGLDADTIAKFNARYSSPAPDTSGQVTAAPNELPTQPSFLPPLANLNVADSASFLADNTPTDADLTRRLYAQQEQAQATAAAADRQVNVLARIRAAAQAQAEKNAATLDAVNQASQTADQAEASAAPLTAQALRQNASETLATASSQTPDAATPDLSTSQTAAIAPDATPTPEPAVQDAVPPGLIEPFQSPIEKSAAAIPDAVNQSREAGASTPPVDTGAPTSQASTETPSPVAAPAESLATETPTATGTESASREPATVDRSSPEPTQAGAPEQAPRLDDRGLPITTIQSDPTEAMRASPDVEATGDTVKELPPKEQTYGSRVNTDYFHLPQERSEYTRETSELAPHPNEADLLTQANTALQRRRYEVENKVGGYEGRGGTNAVDRVLSAAYLKYLRNLREGTSGKDGFKASEVGQVLNNVIRDFQKGASKRKTTVALDAPTAEGGRTVGDSVPDDGPTPSEAAARTDAVGRMRSITSEFGNTLDSAGKERLNSILERVAHGEPPHEMSADDIDLYDRFIEYAQPKFSQAELSTTRNFERGEGAPSVRAPERTAAEDQSPADERQGPVGRGDDDLVRRGATRPDDSTPTSDSRNAPSLEEGASQGNVYQPPAEDGGLAPSDSQVLNDALTQALPTLRRLGVGINEGVKEAGRGASATFNALGEVSLDVNRAGLAEGIKGLNSQERAEYIRHGITEELTHLADTINERDAWNASGRKVDFTEFVKVRKTALLDGIYGDMAKANPRTRALLQGALLDGWNLYHDPQEAARVDAAGAREKTANKDIGFSFDDPKELQKYLAEHPEQVTNYLMETLRQLVQLRETEPAITTETSYAHIYEALRDWVNGLLEKLRAVAADPKAYSKVLADAIDQIERVKNGEPLDFIPRIRAELPEVRPVDRETVRASAPEPAQTLPTLKQISDAYEVRGIKNFVSEKGDTITLSKVVVPSDGRGQGEGTRFMQDLTRYADANGKTIALTPSTDFGGSSVNRLKDFYRRFGFEDNKGRGRDNSISESMVRRPDTTNNVVRVDAPKPIRTRDLAPNASRSDIVRQAEEEIDARAQERGGAIKQFVEGEVKGRLSEGLKVTTDAASSIRNLIAPTTATVESKQSARILRGNLGKLAADDAQARVGLNAAIKAFDKLDMESAAGQKASLQFQSRLEQGLPQATPELTKIAGLLRTALDSRRTLIQNLGTGKLQSFITDYFPHIWKSPEGAEAVMKQVLGKSPLEGSKNFLKERSIDSVAAGVAMGLEPVSWNPIEQTLLKLHEMDRYLMAQRTVDELRAQGLATPVSDPTVPPANGQAKVRLGGAEYVMSADAARPILNYLSPGLRGNALYDALRYGSGLLNSAQLGLSAFHLGFVSVDSTTSKMSLGLTQIARGVRNGDVYKAGQGLANIFKASIPGYAPVEALLQGSKVLREYTKPGSVGGEFAGIADALQQGGGRINLDAFEDTGAGKAFRDAVRKGNYIGALLRAPMAAVDFIPHLIGSEIVPRFKVAAFADLAREEMERLGPDATLDQKRQAYAKAWDSVDNRLGQVVYENLFWNKALKDSLMLTTRSVGWNLGTIREIGGGLLDTATVIKRIKSGDPVLTARMSYIAGLTMTSAMMGGMIHYLYNGKGPDDLKDYFFPRTGKTKPDGTAERLQLPSYVKDILAYKHAPLQTLLDKQSPLISQLVEMYQNKDFYGNEIRNSNDPFVQQIMQEAKFIGSGFVPFQLRASQQRQKQDTLSRVESFFGVTPAPAKVSRTDAQNLMVEKIQERQPSAGKTPEEAQRAQLRKELMTSVGNGDNISAQLNDAVKSGQLTRQAAATLIRNTHVDPNLRMFRALDLTSARQVFDVATPEEKKLFLMPLRMKEAKAGARH